MEPLYHETNRLIIETQQLFQNLESNKKNAEETQNEIENKIDQVHKNCSRLDTYLYKIPLAQRQRAKMRCDQLKYDNRHLQAALKAWQQKRQRQSLEESEREQLLSRRFDPNPDNTTINIDYSLQHNNSLHNANHGLDEMLQTGSSVLDSLRSQRDTFKGVHRRLLNMANTLGLSNTTMRYIEKRVSQDKLILIAGMLITCIIIILIIIYVA